MEDEQEVNEQPGIQDLLKKLGNAPSAEQIEEWKQEHGEIFCSALSEEELLIFRPLKRREYLELQLAAQEQQTPIDGEELIVMKCLLWASTKGKSALQNKAGSLTTIQEQVLQNSNFVAPQVAAALVVKL